MSLGFYTTKKFMKVDIPANIHGVLFLLSYSCQNTVVQNIRSSGGKLVNTLTLLFSLLGMVTSSLARPWAMQNLKYFTLCKIRPKLEEFDRLAWDFIEEASGYKVFGMLCS